MICHDRFRNYNEFPEKSLHLMQLYFILILKKSSETNSSPHPSKGTSAEGIGPGGLDQFLQPVRPDIPTAVLASMNMHATPIHWQYFYPLPHFSIFE